PTLAPTVQAQLQSYSMPLDLGIAIQHRSTARKGSGLPDARDRTSVVESTVIHAPGEHSNVSSSTSASRPTRAIRSRKVVDGVAPVAGVANTAVQERAPVENPPAMADPGGPRPSDHASSRLAGVPHSDLPGLVSPAVAAQEDVDSTAHELVQPDRSPVPGVVEGQSSQPADVVPGPPAIAPAVSSDTSRAQPARQLRARNSKGQVAKRGRGDVSDDDSKVPEPPKPAKKAKTVQKATRKSKKGKSKGNAPPSPDDPDPPTESSRKGKGRA
ncbi:hypothetical protein HDZ31DRAFT_78692, partial [Schizophyllum fasciatum]